MSPRYAEFLRPRAPVLLMLGQEFGSMPVLKGLRIVAWASLAVCVLLTVVPPVWRPVTGLPHDVEHLLMFLIIGLSFTIAYRGREHLIYVAAAVLTALLE